MISPSKEQEEWLGMFVERAVIEGSYLEAAIVGKAV